MRISNFYVFLEEVSLYYDVDFLIGLRNYFCELPFHVSQSVYSRKDY